MHAPVIRSRPYRILLTGTLLWCAAVMAVPLLAKTESALVQGSASFLEECFSHVCHRLPDRSFHLVGKPLGVCVRCTSIYGGFLLGLLVYPVLVRRRRPQLPSRWWLVGAALPTASDALLNILGLVPSTEASRAITGALLGIALTAYIVPLVIEAWSALPHRAWIRRRSHTENDLWTSDRINSVSPS